MMNIASIAIGVVFAVLSITFTSSTDKTEEEPSNRHPIQTINKKQPDSNKESNKPGEPEGQQTQTDKKAKNSNKPVTVTVKTGDTLAKIAKENGTTYQRIFNANDSINQPDVITTGEELTIPADNEELPDRIAEMNARMQAEAEKRKKQRKQAKRQHQEVAPQQTEPQNGQQESTPQPSGANTNTWDRLARCESGGDWHINTGNGYYGGLQFSLSSWRAVGGSGYPHQASKSEQIARGEKLKASQGWAAWPSCAAKLGLL